MRPRPSLFLAVVAGLGLPVGVAGCGSRAVPPSSGAVVHLQALTSAGLPSHLSDLSVESESLPGQVSSATGSYASSIGFYSLRKHKLVEATLEIIELSSRANWRTVKFQSALIDQLSGTVPTEVQLDGRSVYQSAGSGSTLEAWFNGPDVFVLTIRSSYPMPRTLTESALGLHLP